MAIAGWHLIRLVEEAANGLTGAVLESVRFSRETGRLLFVLGSSRGKRFVVISVRGRYPAFYWTRDKSRIGGYSLFVRSEKFNRIRGAVLAGLQLPSADRVVCAAFDQQRGSAARELTLTLAFLGNSGNIWLTETGQNRILETLWDSRGNTVGEPLVLPEPPPLLDWRVATFSDYLRERQNPEVSGLSTLWQNRFWGIDRSLARLIEREVAALEKKTGTVREQTPRELWDEYQCVLGILRKAIDPATPLMVADDDEGHAFGIVPVLHDSTEGQTISLASLLADRDRQETAQVALLGIRWDIRKSLDHNLKRLRRRLEDIDRAIADRARAATLKHRADLLGSSRHLLQRGMSEVSLPDWESGVTVTIPLDSSRSPQQNIDDCYRRARKFERAADSALQARPGIVAAVQQLESWMNELTDPDLADSRLEEIAAAAGIARHTGKTSRPAVARHLPYREFTLAGYRVLVGRSNRDNDELTRHVAHPRDLFFHADGVSGSHVILVRGEAKDRDIPGEAITSAAQLAAFFSKARHSGLVSVVYTEVRHVTKPRKAPPGLVRLNREKSLMVRPTPPPGYHGK